MSRAEIARERVFDNLKVLAGDVEELVKATAEQTDDGVSSLRERIRAYRETMIPFNEPNSGLGRAACPFLINDQCSIYEVRPMVCQRHHSTNLDACIISRFEPEKRPDIPFVMPQIYMMAHLGLGVRKEIFDAGLDTSTVEVGIAAEVVLDHPDAFEKYFSGEDLFAEARIEVPEPVELPRPEEI